MKTKIIKNKSYDNLQVTLKGMQNKVGKVGWFANSRYDDAKQTPVAFIAAQNEYGNQNKRIPARPFMRPTIANKQNEWRDFTEKGAQQILKGTQTTTSILDLLGKIAVGDIQETISKLMLPELSPYTIQRRLERKSNKKTIGALNKPLIDTGIMFTTITNTVE